MGRQVECIRTFFINGQGLLKRQVTCVPTKMRQLNRQLRVFINGQGRLVSSDRKFEIVLLAAGVKMDDTIEKIIGN